MGEEHNTNHLDGLEMVLVAQKFGNT